tara:strand:- start:771 stop:1394 length:624 start_codon:yes stop_codon:yes gene_type:complete
MSKEIIIIDYGLGNILSLKNTLEYLGFKVNYLSTSQKKISDIYIIPGVGSFKKAMTLIKKKKIDIFINKLVQKKTPIIGICLGMQIMGTWGYEDGKTKGLGLIDFSIKKLPIENKKTKLPNIGWKKVNFSFEKLLFLKKFNNKKFYFVHSFAIQKIKKEIEIAKSKFGDANFISAIKKNNLVGFQFHPEKSGEQGLRLLKATINGML